MTVEVESRKRSANGVELLVDEAGPVDGPPLILLHGFPECRYGWRHQFVPLAEAGFRVIVPDQRGYGGSDKPRGVGSYRVEALVDDVVELISTIGPRRATVIGHDWGAIVGWATALRRPDLVERLIVLNGPHPVAMQREIRSNPGQLLKSWYAFGFQLPEVPERMLARHDFRALARGMVASSRPGTFSETDLAEYRKNWAEPGALRSMIHWYRAAIRHPTAFDNPIVQPPTQIIWGPNDRFIGEGVARSSYALCRSGRLDWVKGATHWVQHEEPDRVNRLILEFLAEPAR